MSTCSSRPCGHRRECKSQLWSPYPPWSLILPSQPHPSTAHLLLDQEFYTHTLIWPHHTLAGVPLLPHFTNEPAEAHRGEAISS